MRQLTHMLGGAPDPDHMALRRAVRVLVIGAPLFVLLGWVLDLREASIPAVFAVLSLGARADFGGPLPRRALRYAVTGLVSLAVVPLGAALAGHDVALVATTGVVVFATMYLGTLGGPFFAARFPVLLSFLFAVTARSWGDTLGQRMLGWAVGAVAIGVASLVLWPWRPPSGVPTQVAATCRAVAAGFPPDRLLGLVHELRKTAVGAHLRAGAVAADERVTAELVHATERLVAVWITRDEVAPAPEDAALSATTIETLTQCADAVDGTAVPDALAPRLERAIADQVAVSRARVDARTSAAVDLATRGLTARRVARSACTVAHLVDEMRGKAAGDEAADVLADRPLDALRGQWNLRSLWMRNAIRAALALMVAVVLVLWGAGEGHGFWIALGAFSVLRADLASSRHTAATVIVGTAVGFLVSSAAIVISDPSEWALWGLFPIGLFFAASGTRFGPIPSAAGFTTLFVSVYSLVEPAGLRTGETRVIDVALGAGVTLLIGAVLWPRVGTAPHGLLADVVDRSRRELAGAVDRVSGRVPIARVDPRGPLALLSDLDRVLDTIASDAPGDVTDGERATILATVSTTVTEAVLLDGTRAPRWIGFGSEDRIPSFVDDARLAAALVADGARADDALAASVRRLSGDRRAADGAVAEPALFAVAGRRLTEPAADADRTFGAIRVGAGLDLVVRLASRDANASTVARQTPTATGTLE